MCTESGTFRVSGVVAETGSIVCSGDAVEGGSLNLSVAHDREEKLPIPVRGHGVIYGGPPFALLLDESGVMHESRSPHFQVPIVLGGEDGEEESGVDHPVIVPDEPCTGEGV